MLEANKMLRQYVCLFLAVISYFTLHEGAHLLLALYYNVFEQVNFMGLGMQIAINREALSETQFIVFNIGGVVTTLVVGYVLVLLTKKIVTIKSKAVKAAFYYVTLTMLFTDCLYLAVLSSFFGGGDLNGIALLFPTEMMAKILFGVIGILNLFIFIRFVYPKYAAAYKD